LRKKPSPFHPLPHRRLPRRNEIDATQELFYPAIMRAIAETGYTGHVGQEFIPLGNAPLASLRQGVAICRV